MKSIYRRILNRTGVSPSGEDDHEFETPGPGTAISGEDSEIADEIRRYGGGGLGRSGRAYGRGGYGRRAAPYRRVTRPRVRSTWGQRTGRWPASRWSRLRGRPWGLRRWRYRPAWSVATGGTVGTEFVRWVQSALNRVLGTNLVVDGVMNYDTRSAVRRFQQDRGLPADGIVGPDTRQALIAAQRGDVSDGPPAGAPLMPPPPVEDAPPAPEDVPPDTGTQAANQEVEEMELDALVREAMEWEENTEGEGEEEGEGEQAWEAAADSQCDCQSTRMPSKGYFSTPLAGGHAWYTPTRGDYGEKLARCVATKNRTAEGRWGSPSYDEVRRVWVAIENHPCNRQRLAGRWFLPRFRRDRCTPGGPYYGAIYIPFNLSDGSGRIVGGPRCS